MEQERKKQGDMCKMKSSKLVAVLAVIHGDLSWNRMFAIIVTNAMYR